MFFVSQNQSQGSFNRLKNLVVLLGISSMTLIPCAEAKIFYAASSNGSTYGCDADSGYWAVMNTGANGQVTPGASLPAGFQIPSDAASKVINQIMSDPKYKNQCPKCSYVQPGRSNKGSYTPPKNGGQSRFGGGTGSMMDRLKQQEQAYDQMRNQMQNRQNNRNQ